MTNRHFPFKKYMNILTHFPGSFKNVNCISDLDTILEESNYLSGWFLEAPKFTTIRINTLAISPEEVKQIIETGLREESEKCCQTSALIYTHPVLTDCLVIGPWHDQDVKNDFSNCEVIVDAACGAAVLRGADVFAPGIMGIPKSEFDFIHSKTPAFLNEIISWNKRLLVKI
uniref:Uncharacterized protein n=1 Tax=Clastoptera arizonana TaxID=38151 RepID=A0A1B6CGT1_9HEMI